MNATTFLFGIVTGLLVAALVMLSTLMRYVSSGLDGFRKWLDNSGASS